MQWAMSHIQNRKYGENISQWISNVPTSLRNSITIFTGWQKLLEHGSAATRLKGGKTMEEWKEVRKRGKGKEGVKAGQ